jgi:photosystem II biogenesis protein Psp29
VNTVRTVSDTKRAFYTLHTRPVSSVYRRVVEELMVEIHLLRVNEDFRRDPIFALGVVGTFDRFMAGYEPATDRDSIFKALCGAEELDPSQFRGDAESAKAAVAGRSSEDVLAWVTQSAASGGQGVAGTLHTIASNTKFKYSRLFAIGLYNLLESVDSVLVTDAAKLNEFIEKLAAPLNLSATKIQRDLELYRGNIDKLEQAQKAMAEFIEGERRRQQKRAEELQQKADAAAEAAVAPEAEAEPEPDSATPSA